MDKIIMKRAKPFRAEPIGFHKFCVQDDGTVLVYDSVAGHFTRCHALTAQQLRRIRQSAEEL
jgi:hypothetical protein